MAAVMKSCAHCGAIYPSKNERSTYCTQSCGVKARRIVQRANKRQLVDLSINEANTL